MIMCYCCILSSYIIQRMAYYQQNTLSIATRKCLAQLIAELINTSQTIEEFRESLAQVPGFDTLSLFRWLDRQQKGFLAEKDLEFVVGTKHRKLLTYAFSWIDIPKVGQISRFEFAHFLLPRENLTLRQLNLKNLEQSQMKPQCNTLSVQFGRFHSLLKEIMAREMKIIDLRLVLIGRNDYSLEGVRFALTNCERQWICTQDILNFMPNFGFQVSNRQVGALVEALNKDGQGKITLDQLKWVTEGLESKEKQYLQKVKAGNRKKPLPKPKIEEEKFKRYLSSQKKSKNIQQQQFSTLMSRIKAVERLQKKHEKALLQNEKSRIQSARKEYEQQIVELRLKREQQSLRKIQQRQAQLAQHQMQLQLDHILLQTAKLEQQSERLIRQQNRIAIIQDSALIKKQINSQFYAQQYQRMRKARERQRLVLSPPRVHNRLSIQSHIKATQQYLNNARHTHQQLMRQRKQQSLIFNKQNEMRQEMYIKKTPGTLMNKNKSFNEPSCNTRQNNKQQTQNISKQIPQKIAQHVNISQ